MKRELFLILLVIIGILLWKYSFETEEFQDFVMPKPNPQPSPVAKEDPSPFAPPSTSLLAPPPGQTASVNSYPADDPAQKKANTKRIKGLLETLNGFLNREGPGLAELGDPAVQIPLQTARADARRLTDEASVLERNPGVESTLSETNVYDIEANLTYLQKKWRLSANSMSGVEGFQGGPSGDPSEYPPDFPVSSTYKPKGIALDFKLLPSRGNTLNDYYIMDLTFDLFQWNTYALWNGSAWVLKGLPNFTVVETIQDVKKLSTLTYADIAEGSVYKIYNKVGPYTVYLAWMGGQPGPANTPQDIINVLKYIYNQPNNIYGPNDIKTGSAGVAGGRFRFIATTSSNDINTLIHDIIKSRNYEGLDKGSVKNISELPLINNDLNDYYMIDATSDASLFTIWRANSWVGDVKWDPSGASREGFQSTTGTPVLTPQLIQILTNLLTTSGPSGGSSGGSSDGPSGGSSGGLLGGSSGGSSDGPSGGSSGGSSDGPSPSRPPPPSGGPSPSRPPPPSDKKPSDFPSGGSSGGSASITVAQLNTLQLNISATITRLTNSGSTNPLLQQRINVLETVLHSVNKYITEINRGTMKPNDIPISVSSYNKFLPFVDPTMSLNLNEPLPKLIMTTGASPALLNLFPYLFGGDISGVDLARSLFDKYAKSFFTDTSYQIDLKFNHKSESERRIAESVAKSALNPLLNSYGSDSDDYYGSKARKDGSTHGTAPKTAGSRGETEARTTMLSGSTDGKTVKSHVSSSADRGSVSSTPATMDWKARSEQICSQISKRGLNPNDYGCLKNPKDVDENFSFRGHARMVCSRLGTHYDPGIPDLCGCPPPTWPGWRP